jgi:hypothetical protein
MTLGTTAAILLGIGGAGAGFAASKIIAGNQNNQASPLPLPEPPAKSTAEDKASVIGKAKRAAATQSVYTSPLGIGGQADVTKKVLLGQ